MKTDIERRTEARLGRLETLKRHMSQQEILDNQMLFADWAHGVSFSFEQLLGLLAQQPGFSWERVLMISNGAPHEPAPEPPMEKSKRDEALEVLGLGPDASASDIKSAYRKKAKEYHPDRGGDPARMRAINRAYKEVC